MVLETKRASMARSGRLKQELMESQTKAKEKRRFTNGSNRIQQMSGSITKELIMVGTALVGNHTQYTKDKSKATKLTKFMGLHSPTKERLLQAHLQMCS